MSKTASPSALSAHPSPRHRAEVDLSPAHAPQVGMICFLCSEAAFFATLIVAYITFLGQGGPGPTPAEALDPWSAVAGTVALLSSSITAHFAGTSLRRGNASLFRAWLLATIILGALFLVGTAIEWRGLIVDQGLTISRNLFGTTYFTLVGFHALHVTIGLILLTLMGLLSLANHVSREHRLSFELVTWYWHFVDSVWIAVFAVVYVFGR